MARDLPWPSWASPINWDGCRWNEFAPLSPWVTTNQLCPVMISSYAREWAQWLWCWDNQPITSKEWSLQPTMNGIPCFVGLHWELTKYWLGMMGQALYSYVHTLRSFNGDWSWDPLQAAVWCSACGSRSHHTYTHCRCRDVQRDIYIHIYAHICTYMHIYIYTSTYLYMLYLSILKDRCIAPTRPGPAIESTPGDLWNWKSGLELISS